VADASEGSACPRFCPACTSGRQAASLFAFSALEPLDIGVVVIAVVVWLVVVRLAWRRRWIARLLGIAEQV
jgi:hypothetical protein